MRWLVWFVTYGTYAEPNVEPYLVTGPMSFAQAKAVVDKRGFGYCMKPEKP